MLTSFSPVAIVSVQVTILSDQVIIESSHVFVSDQGKTTHVSVSTEGIVIVFTLSPLTVTLTSGNGSCCVGTLR